MEKSQIITVESSNTSYNNNTNSFFRVRLPQTLNFEKPYEIALIDASIPASIHNVQNDAYFALVLHKKVADVGDKSDQESKVTDPSHLTAGDRQLEGHRIQAYVKFPVLQGYYTSPESLLVGILEEGLNLLDRHTVTISEYFGTWSGNISAVSKLIKNSAPGIYTFKPTFINTHAPDNTLADIKRIITDTFTSTLARFKFKPHIGLLRIYPIKSGSEERHISVSCHFSQDIAFILGQPAEAAFYLPHAMQKSLFSNFLCRIQPTNTIYLYCPELMESIVSNIQTPILKILAFSAQKLGFGDLYYQSFQNPIYIELNTRRLSELTFELRGSNGKRINFLNSTYPVRLTLCLREKAGMIGQ